jgi:hypothetical protein
LDTKKVLVARAAQVSSDSDSTATLPFDPELGLKIITFLFSHKGCSKCAPAKQQLIMVSAFVSILCRPNRHRPSHTGGACCRQTPSTEPVRLGFRSCTWCFFSVCGRSSVFLCAVYPLSQSSYRNTRPVGTMHRQTNILAGSTCSTRGPGLERQRICFFFSLLAVR